MSAALADRRPMPRAIARVMGRVMGRVMASLALAAALAAPAPAALAQGTGTPAAPAAEGPAPNPAPSNAIEIDAARRFDLTPAGTHQTYYRASYLGKVLTAQGTPLKQASGLDLLAPALPAAAGGASGASGASAGSGDRRDWTLRYENREARLGGSLLEAEGLQPLRLGALSDLDLRGTVAIATDRQGTRAAVGLETPPWRLPAFAGREVANWLVLGLNGQRDPAPAGGNAEDRALVTYRAFVGKGFGWRRSAGSAATGARIEAEVLKMAPTFKAASNLAGKIRQAAARGIKPSAGEERLLLVVEEAEAAIEDEAAATPAAAAAGTAARRRPRTPAAAAPAESAGAPAPTAADRLWQQAVRTAAREIADAQDTRPTFAAYAEASGWYTAKGQLSGERRQRNLVIATLDWWLVPTRDDLFLRLRYEDGHEWTAPARRKQQVSVALTVRL
jgi:hypothetical protein